MSDDNNNNDGKYKVGYCKPPKETQFKPGQSGNPEGRPANAIELLSLFEDVLREDAVIKENGRMVTTIAARAVYKRLIYDAVHGNTRAAALILDFLDRQDIKEFDTWKWLGKIK